MYTFAGGRVVRWPTVPLSGGVLPAFRNFISALACEEKPSSYLDHYTYMLKSDTFFHSTVFLRIIWRIDLRGKKKFYNFFSFFEGCGFFLSPRFSRLDDLENSCNENREDQIIPLSKRITMEIGGARNLYKLIRVCERIDGEVGQVFLLSSC